MRDTNARTDGIRNLIQARLRFHISRSNIMLRHSAWRRGATVHQLRSPIGHHCAVRHPADSPPENAPCRRPFIQPSSSSAPAWPAPRSSRRSLPASPTATTSACSARNRTAPTTASSFQAFSAALRTPPTSGSTRWSGTRTTASASTLASRPTSSTVTNRLPTARSRSLTTRSCWLPAPGRSCRRWRG